MPIGVVAAPWMATWACGPGGMSETTDRSGMVVGEPTSITRASWSSGIAAGAASSIQLPARSANPAMRRFYHIGLSFSGLRDPG